MTAHWLIAYDITDRRRLAKTHRTLSRHALPLQNSVFLYKGTQQEAEKLFATLTGQLKPDDDLRFYPLAPNSPIYQLKGNILAEGIVLCGYTPPIQTE